MDGLAIKAAYTPSGGVGVVESSTEVGALYTGIEGLTLAYGAGEDNSTTTSADATAWKVSYAYGPVTVTAVSYTHLTLPTKA